MVELYIRVDIHARGPGGLVSTVYWLRKQRLYTVTVFCIIFNSSCNEIMKKSVQICVANNIQATSGSLYSIHSAVVIGGVVSAINMPVLSVYILKFDVDGGYSEPWGFIDVDVAV